MGNSLQDQFLKLGLVDKKKVNTIKKQKHRKKKQQPAKKQVVDENVLLAKAALEKKRARARELNLLRDEKLKKRETAAAIRQMIISGMLEKDESGIAYRFNAGGRIQRIFVSKEMADKLSSGQLAIVTLGDKYEVVARETAEKILQLDSGIFVLINIPEKERKSDDDPYAEYEVPDDLMW
jgi:uncharacterized protein YaiL (DUF2058 family)